MARKSISSSAPEINGFELQPTITKFGYLEPEAGAPLLVAVPLELVPVPLGVAALFWPAPVAPAPVELGAFVDPGA
jgi:hypothetical protein